MFKGSLVALITPMHTDGTVDLVSLRNLIEWHIAEKTDGLVILGTTGEAATINATERENIIATAMQQVAGRIPVIVGTGTNDTQTTIALTQQAEKAGVDACLVVTPYYSKPPQNGLYEHYKTLASHTKLPIILYNVPGRTACDLLPETTGRLATINNIIGIKDATGKLERVAELRQACGAEFALYSGDDETGADFILAGGQGVISVTANIAPQQMHAMCTAALAGDKALTQQLDKPLRGLHKKLFVEANPIPTKWALAEMGKMPPGIRLPLVPLNPRCYPEVRQALHEAGILQTSTEN